MKNASLKSIARLGIWILLGCAPAARAFFQQAASPAAPTSVPAALAAAQPATPTQSKAGNLLVAGLAQIGSGPVLPETSNASDLPMTDAMAVLLPQGWRYAPLGAAAKVNPKLSWSGTVPWTDELNQICLDHGLHCVADWKSKTLFTTVATVATRLALAKPAIEHWNVRAGQTLKQTLVRWGTRAGEQIVWQSARARTWDLPIIANASFTGSFSQAVGVMLGDLSGNKVRFVGQMYSNHVLVISAVTGR